MGGFSSSLSGKQVEATCIQVARQHSASSNMTINTWCRVVQCQAMKSMQHSFMLKVHTSWNNNAPSVCMFACIVTDTQFIVKTLCAMRTYSDQCIDKIRCVRVGNTVCNIDVHIINQRNEVYADIALHHPQYVMTFSPINGGAVVDGTLVAEYDIQYID